MVALAPCLLLAVWIRRRPQFAASAAALAATGAVLLLPFVLWDPRGVWENMVASYPRLMKEVVWDSADRGAINTLGLTGWLLSRGWQRFVEASQVVALAATYVVAWRAMRRGASPLPWMGLALLVFSMTSLWPVFYIYFDVFLLLACAAFAETAGIEHAPGGRAWFATAGTLALVVLAGVRIAAGPFPSIDMSAPDRELTLLQGFGPRRADGDRTVREIAAEGAVFGLPRASREAGVVVIEARTPGLPQRVSALLNGRLLGTATSDSEWRTLRFPAPAAAWWFGFNRLELVFSEGHPPLGVSRIGVEP
jgi:hypothetical protein